MPSEWGVELVRWPQEAELRRWFALAGVPRILVVTGDAAPPADLDPGEGWIREPYLADDLRARAREARLATTRRHDDPAWLGPDHVLHVGPAEVALSPSQAVVARALLDADGEPVSGSALASALSADGHHRDPGAVEVTVSRLRRRLVSVGLAVRCVRGRGYVLGG